MNRTRKPEEGWILSRLEHLPSPAAGYQSYWLLGIQTSGFHQQLLWFSGPLTSGWIVPLAYLDLQLAEGRVWDFLTFIVTWASSHNESSHGFVGIYGSIWIFFNRIYLHPICSGSLGSPHYYITSWPCVRTNLNELTKMKCLDQDLIY
jgi:hypothetical protein